MWLAMKSAYFADFLFAAWSVARLA